MWYLLPGLPSIETLRDTRLQVPLRVYTREYSLIAEFGEKRRTPVKIADVPDTIKQAFLSAEDDRFYQHPGVDWQGLVRAVMHLLRTGEKGQGGSTITMQVARNFFLSSEKTYLRKLNEILLALKIERELQKSEILELYLNKIYLGHRAYGVIAAAEVYYGKELGNLTLAQAAMIAALPKAPSRINPITSPERAMQRRNYVLGRMLKLQYIDQASYDSALSQPITASYHGQSPEVEAPFIAEMVRSQMLEQYGDDAYTTGIRVITTVEAKLQTAANQALRKALIDYDQRHGYRGPEHHFDDINPQNEAHWASLLEAYTPIGGLNAALVVSITEQTASVFSRENGLISIEWPGLSWARSYINANRRGAAPKTTMDILSVGDVIRYQRTEELAWQLTQLPAIEGALVSMDPDNGAILALIGGFDFSRSKFNRVTQARRQPGSNFKPFIYSAALEKGFTAASLINDAPVVFDDVSLEDKWRPENYSGKYFGPTRLREALTKSRNLISIRLLRSMGVSYAIEYASRFGFKPEELPANLSLSLGSASLTPLQIVTGYSVFANGGYRVEANLIKRIEDYDGDTVFINEPITVCRICEQQTPDIDAELYSTSASEEENSKTAKRVVDARNVWLINSILRDVITRGTGRRARELQRKDLSGKTGTTNDQNDAWFSGFNSRIATTAWVGFDQLQTLGKQETGGRAALPMWIDFMRTALDGMPESVMQQPPGLTTVRIDPETGLQTGADNPKAFFEVFREEHVPALPTSTNNNGHLPDANGLTPDIPEQLF